MSSPYADAQVTGLRPGPAPARVGVICDFADEGWASMDLVGEMLVTQLHERHRETVRTTLVRPHMARRFRALSPFAPAVALNADRLLARFVDYPRTARTIANDFDLFHVIDHSYSQLLHTLPPDRTIVTCHDLDTFRCLLEPGDERRSSLFRLMARRILDGFRKAAMVTCDNAATRDAVLSYRLLPPERLVVVPNGVHPSCSPTPKPLDEAEAVRLLGPEDESTIDLLHVGSTIRRKRIDVLLRVFAAVRRHQRQARLIRVGGPLTAEQRRLAEQLGVTREVITLPFLSRETLAAVYRRAAVVLQPSDTEGFGLPVIEAMACATPVIASRIPALRDVGGDAAAYAPVGDVDAWADALQHLLRERAQDPDRWQARRAAGLAQAAKFTWGEYAQQMVDLYRRVLQQVSPHRHRIATTG